MKLKLIIFACLLSISFSTNKEIWININWVDNLEKDFSFRNKWSYPEGVYKNEFGQLTCDGGVYLQETDKMKDNNGKIYPDSLHAFYQIVDTTHLFHSIKSEASTYEWAGTDFINFKTQKDGTIIGQTACNASTHSSLNIKIKKNAVTAWIDYNSISRIEKYIFPMQKGQIIIDKQLFIQGIIKAEFDIVFENKLDFDKKMYWKGLIYSKIKK